MELKITSPQEGGFTQEIKWNNEELKKEIATKMQDYNSLAFTENTIKEAKEDRAKLNKLKNAFEAERKRIKKLCLAPYEAFEKQIKEVTGLIDEPIALIDKQIKEVEENKRIKRKGELLDFYNSNIGTLKGILSFEKVLKPKYLNASENVKSITKEIADLIQRVNTDLDTIEGLGTKFEMQMKDVYIKNLDLSLALQEKARLEVMEERLGERRRKEQEVAEMAAKKKAAEQAAIPPSRQPSTPEQKEEPKVTMDFRVVATKEQFLLLKEFLQLNNIKYGKVPEGE